MAASFSLTGQVRLTPRWTDELNATDVIDATSIIESITLANGTGNGQANCYWKDVRTVAAAGQDVIDLTALPLKAYGGQVSVSLTALRAIYVRNRSATATLFHYIKGGDGEVVVVPGGVFLWFAPQTPSPINYPISGWQLPGSEVVIYNAGVSSADYEIILVGVKA